MTKNWMWIIYFICIALFALVLELTGKNKKR